MVAQTQNSQRLENKRDPEENPRSLYPARFALAPAGVPGLGASPGVWASCLRADQIDRKKAKKGEAADQETRGLP